MRLHKLLVEHTVLTLHSILVEGRYADKAIERALRSHPKWGSRDRRFFAEAVYDIVRWRRLLEYASSGQGEVSMWSLWGAWWVHKGMELPDWPELKGLRADRLRAALEAAPSRAVQGSIPDWLDDLGQLQFGAGWPRVLEALNQPGEVFLRPNTLKCTATQLQQQLQKEGVEAELIERGDVASLRLTERKNVFVTAAFKAGLFEVQDLHSQQVVPLLGLQPGEVVIDACAGAGGKSLHMAAMMKNKGKILALDIHQHKLLELKRRAARASVDVIETRPILNNKVVKRLEGRADAVLLDVPCSGLGVLRRNPDTKWKLKAEDLDRLAAEQVDILTRYSRLLKPGGRMVYATCSWLKSENEDRIDAFLESHPDWVLEKSLRLDPAPGEGDGFFAARLSKATS